MITVIGIGRKKGDITLSSAKIIEKAKRVYLRTALTEAGSAAAKEYPHVVPLDGCYEKAENFDEWQSAVCDILLKAESECGDAVYLSDGDGVDGVVTRLCERSQSVQLSGGVTAPCAMGKALCEMKIPASDALNTRPYIDTAVPLRVTEIDDKFTAGDIKLWLMEFYDDDVPITVSVKGKSQTVPLCELDRLQGYDYSCEIFIEGQSGFFKKKYGFGDLMRVMSRLTAADGCPWDKAQTHESIRINMLEEAYEAVDAIDSGDVDGMIEELGDVMLQSVFHCDMAKRFGEFDVSDVISALCGKLVFRHTHIFGENKAKSADEALSFWEAAKSEEKNYVSTADKLNRLPEGFSALLAAQKVYKKLNKAGVKDDPEAVSAFDIGDEKQCAKTLFWLVAAMSQKGIDAEVALNSLVSRIKKDFEVAEKSGQTEDFLQKL